MYLSCVFLFLQEITHERPFVVERIEKEVFDNGDLYLEYAMRFIREVWRKGISPCVDAVIVSMLDECTDDALKQWNAICKTPGKANVLLTQDFFTISVHLPCRLTTEMVANDMVEELYSRMAVRDNIDEDFPLVMKITISHRQ